MAANPPAVPGRHKPVVHLCCPVFRFCQRFSLEIPVERATQAYRVELYNPGAHMATLSAGRFVRLSLWHLKTILLFQTHFMTSACEILPCQLKYCRHFKVFFTLRISAMCSELCRIFHSMPFLSACVGPLIYAVTEAARAKRIYFQVGLSRSLESRTAGPRRTTITIAFLKWKIDILFDYNVWFFTQQPERIDKRNIV